MTGIPTGFAATLSGGVDVVAAQGLVDQWRDLGPVLWLGVAAAAAVWTLVLGVAAFCTRSRQVTPGPATLDLGGTEPAAVVNLITGDWSLGHEAVPATLLDLAARKVVAIDQVGEQALVRLRPDSTRAQEEAAGIEPYERMVLDHVVHHAVDGVVPAEALTTGPEHEARGWWRKFRRSVELDARHRGLSRQRWSRPVHTVLLVASVAVAVLVAIAATTLPDDPDDTDDDPVGAALALGGVAAGALILMVEAANGERDTPAGRKAAGRWLGLRTILADDPLFSEYPPAGVAVWDRLLAFGAAMGVAHGAVRALPLGAESDKEAWSSMGGHWRVVRIRYPRFVPPGYGRRPGLVVLSGLVQVVLAAAAARVAAAAADGIGDFAAGFSSDESVPYGVRIGIGIGLGVLVALVAVLAVRGVAMVVAGAVDLFSPRRLVEGRVLRVRRRGDDEHPRWYTAVDDGTTDRVWAWCTAPGLAQGSTVRAEVSRWLSHVRNLELAAPAPVRPSLPDDEDETAGKPLAVLLGASGGSDRSAPETPHRPTGPPPPLPDATVVSAVIGRPVEQDSDAQAHPLAEAGRSAGFAAADGTMVQLAWVDSGLLQAHRCLPRFLRRELTGVGEEAYRAVVGGGVVARQGDHVLVVMGRLPGSADAERDQAFAGLARAAIGAGRPGFEAGAP